MNGIVVLDKPKDMSSAQVVGQLKRLLKAKKVGHTGTLDPMATGVLVCCINQATRLSPFFVQGKKCYEAVMCLGIETDTQDMTGEVLSEVSSLEITAVQMEDVFRRFRNMTTQVPPSYSALKHQGKPLYKMAREGIFVQKPSRPITIYRLDLLEMELPFVRFTVCCSQGTYVRTLCADMGRALGCGAHLAKLRRTESGGFGLEDAMSLTALSSLVDKGQAAECVISMNRALKDFPEVKADGDLAQWIRYGRPLSKKRFGTLGDEDATWVKVTEGERLIAILDARESNGFFSYRCVFSSTEP